jgi:hypothetical protein
MQTQNLARRRRGAIAFLVACLMPASAALARNDTLAFIKTANTPNGHVEVHLASGASNYQNRVLETPTTFVNESDGVWSLVVP